MTSPETEFEGPFTFANLDGLSQTDDPGSNLSLGKKQI